MSTENISIRRITNIGPMGIILSFSDYEISLSMEESTELYTIPLGEPKEKLEITMIIPAGGITKSQTLWLWYEVTADETNQFYFDVLNESRGPQVVTEPTSPGTDVSLDIGYSGDGVVIVGTGDM